MQLAEVGDPRVGGEVRLQVDHALERARRRRRSGRARPARRRSRRRRAHARAVRRGLLAERSAAAEVVAREGERAEPLVALASRGRAAAPARRRPRRARRRSGRRSRAPSAGRRGRAARRRRAAGASRTVACRPAIRWSVVAPGSAPSRTATEAARSGSRSPRREPGPRGDRDEGEQRRHQLRSGCLVRASWVGASTCVRPEGAAARRPPLRTFGSGRGDPLALAATGDAATESG